MLETIMQHCGELKWSDYNHPLLVVENAWESDPSYVLEFWLQKFRGIIFSSTEMKVSTKALQIKQVGNCMRNVLCIPDQHTFPSDLQFSFFNTFWTVRTYFEGGPHITDLSKIYKIPFISENLQCRLKKLNSNF